MSNKENGHPDRSNEEARRLLSSVTQRLQTRIIKNAGEDADHAMSRVAATRRSHYRP